MALSELSPEPLFQSLGRDSVLLSLLAADWDADLVVEFQSLGRDSVLLSCSRLYGHGAPLLAIFPRFCALVVPQSIHFGSVNRHFPPPSLTLRAVRCLAPIRRLFALALPVTFIAFSPHLPSL